MDIDYVRLNSNPAAAGFVCNDSSSQAWVDRVAQEWDKYFSLVAEHGGFLGFPCGIVGRGCANGVSGIAGGRCFDVEDRNRDCGRLLGEGQKGVLRAGEGNISETAGSLDSGVDVVGGSVAVPDVVVGRLGAVEESGVSKVRGKHYKRNKAKAMRRRRVVAAVGTMDGGDEAGDRRAQSVFSSCDDETRKSLAESRARMLIAENEARRAKAESYARHMSLVAKSRVNETKFELDRQTVEEKLQRISARRLGLIDNKGMPLGKVETVVSDSGLGSYSSPSMTSGSISPNSSISMQEVNEMKAKIELLALKEAEANQKLADSDKALSLLRGQMSGMKGTGEEVNAVEDSLNREKRFLKDMNAIYEYSIPQSSEKNYSVGSYDGPL